MNLQPQPMVQPARRSRGVIDALAFFYGLWSFSALGRSTYEYFFKNPRPSNLVPAHLSTFVGVLYVFIIIGLGQRSPRAWWVTVALLVVELAGVLVVGTLDVFWHLFPYATVWSGYGVGYFFIPLILPFLGLAWILGGRTRVAYGVGQ